MCNCNNQHLFMYKRQWGGTLQEFCPFILNGVKPYPRWAAVEFFSSPSCVLLGSAAGSSGARRARVCFLQPLQHSPGGTASLSLLSLSTPGQRKGLGGLPPIPTAECACSNLDRLTGAFPGTPCHHRPHSQNNQEIGR